MKLFVQLLRQVAQALARRLFSPPVELVPAPVRPRPHQYSGRTYDGKSRRLAEPNRW